MNGTAKIRRPGRFAPSVFWCLLAWLALSVPAYAGPFRYFGFDGGAVATANSEIVYGRGVGVLYTNPALMSRFEEQTSVQFVLYKPGLAVDLMDRPKAADITFIYYDTNVTKYPDNPDRPLPTIELRNPRDDNSVDDVQTYLGAGVTHSFGLTGFRLGALVMLPLVEMISIETYYPDEREQYFTNTVHFARFGEWSPIVGGLFGLSYMPVEYVTFGISLQGTASTTTEIDIYIPEATVQDYSLVKNKTSMVGSVRPIVGVQVEPLDFLALGLVWKWRSYISVDGTGRMNLWKFHETFEDVEERKTVPKRVMQKFRFAFDYEPMELTGGVGFSYEDWRIQSGVTWNRWADFRDLYDNQPQDSALYPDNEPEIEGGRFKFSDTVSLNAGTTYSYLEYFEARAGFSYRPSPVPAQVGRTNYADGDIFCAALGHRLDFPILKEEFFAELGFQFWWMRERKTYKDPKLVKDEFPDNSVTLLENEELASAKGMQTNNPGYPGYRQKGWMFVTAVSFGYKF